MDKVDLICPIYHVDWNFLSSNIDSWNKELFLHRMIFGIATKDDEGFEMISNYLTGKFVNALIIDQRQHKTLGYCLKELMDHVQTEWFVYVHADVELTDRSMYIMETYCGEATGIIESDRLHYDGKEYTYEPYYFADRSYSGFQLIRKEAIEPILSRIEDDFIYRNEDLIFQNACINNEYFYVKTLAMHIHQITTTKNWTHKRFKTFDMQWRGLVKYTTPTDVTVDAAIAALRVCNQEFDADMANALTSMSLPWQKAIINKIF
jgi:hypothetical protein